MSIDSPPPSPDAPDAKPITAGANATKNANIPWWRSGLSISAVATFITALAGVGTVATNYAVERAKLRAQADSLNAKLLSDSEDRKDKSAAAERDLRTKYVDIALQPTLGIDHRARIFGYLATVLTDDAQHKWAVAESRKADQERLELTALRRELDKALADSSTSTQRYLQALTSGRYSEIATKTLQVAHTNEQEKINLLRARIQELQGSVPTTASSTNADVVVTAGAKTPGQSPPNRPK